jgi:cell division protein FtsL
MTRAGVFDAVLAVALAASAMALVRSSHESRQLFADIERAQAEAARLQAEQQRLQAERQARTAPGRVQALARERLHMRIATSEVTLNHPADIAAAAALARAPAPARKPARGAP